MRRLSLLVTLALGAAAVIAAILISCSQKPVDGEMMAAPNPRPSEKRPSQPARKDMDLQEELKPAFFDYDKSFIRSDARKAIEENAAWLKQHPEVQVQIEGHCDERGTREYNYRLGAKRADGAKELLVKMGVAADRIDTVSYGALDGQNPKTWQRYRKAVFVLIYPKAKEQAE